MFEREEANDKDGEEEKIHTDWLSVFSIFKVIVHGSAAVSMTSQRFRYCLIWINNNIPACYWTAILVLLQ